MPGDIMYLIYLIKTLNSQTLLDSDQDKIHTMYINFQKLIDFLLKYSNRFLGFLVQI